MHTKGEEVVEEQCHVQELVAHRHEEVQAKEEQAHEPALCLAELVEQAKVAQGRHAIVAMEEGVEERDEKLGEVEEVA